MKKIDAKPTKRQTERVRALLQGQALASRVQAYALELPDPRTGKPVEMTAGQLKAALALIDKCLPSLQAVDSVTTVKDERNGAQLKEQAAALLRARGMPEEQIESLLSASLQ